MSLKFEERQGGDRSRILNESGAMIASLQTHARDDEASKITPIVADPNKAGSFIGNPHGASVYKLLPVADMKLTSASGALSLADVAETLAYAKTVKE